MGVDPVENSKICDSNGCGDSFVGGFLAQLSLIDETKNEIGQQDQNLTKDEIIAAVKAGNLMAGEVL